MGKQQDSKIVFARLQAHRHQVGDSLGKQRLLEGFEPSSGERRQRLFELRQIPERDHAAAPVSQFGDVVAGLGLLQFLQELGGKSLLHRRNVLRHCAETRMTAAARRQRRHQTVDKCLHAEERGRCAESNCRGIDSQGRKCEGVFLHRVALIFKQHHYHRDRQQHLRNRPRKPPSRPAASTND